MACHMYSERDRAERQGRQAGKCTLTAPKICDLPAIQVSKHNCTALATQPGYPAAHCRLCHRPVMTTSGLKDAICSHVFCTHSSSIFSSTALRSKAMRQRSSTSAGAAAKYPPRHCATHSPRKAGQHVVAGSRLPTNAVPAACCFRFGRAPPEAAVQVQQRSWFGSLLRCTAPYCLTSPPPSSAPHSSGSPPSCTPAGNPEAGCEG